MKNYVKVLSFFLVISVLCNIFALMNIKQSKTIIQQETVDKLIDDNLRLENDFETREKIRTLNHELLNAMYSNKQTEIQLKIDKMEPYLTSTMMEEYKRQTAYYDSINMDPNIVTSVTNIIKSDSLKTVVEKQDNSEREVYYSFSLFELETTLPGESNKVLYSNMLCQFVWVLENDEWKVNKFIWNHAITSAYQKF